MSNYYCHHCNQLKQESDFYSYDHNKCKACYIKAARDLRFKLKRELQAEPHHRDHGTMRGVRAGCRCEACSRANRDYRAKQRILRRLEHKNG